MKSLLVGQKLRHDERLTATEKVVFLEVFTEDYLNGKCNKTNDEIARLLDKSRDTISRSVTKLSDIGYLKITYIKGKRILNTTGLDKEIGKAPEVLHIESDLKKEFG